MLVALVFVARLDRNPLVRLEARLGLSPSPIERLFGVKGMFSGMTEAAYRLSHGDVTGATASNVLFVPFAVVVIGAIAAGWRPRIRHRQDEVVALMSVLVLTLLVNLF